MPEFTIVTGQGEDALYQAELNLRYIYRVLREQQTGQIQLVQTGAGYRIGGVVGAFFAVSLAKINIFDEQVDGEEAIRQQEFAIAEIINSLPDGEQKSWAKYAHGRRLGLKVEMPPMWKRDP